MARAGDWFTQRLWRDKRPEFIVAVTTVDLAPLAYVVLDPLHHAGIFWLATVHSTDFTAGNTSGMGVMTSNFFFAYRQIRGFLLVKIAA